MNESEKDRILRMVSEGVIRPNEAAKLLAALKAEETPPPSMPAKKAETAPEPPKAENQVVQMKRPDGSTYTIEVPPQLIPTIMKIVGVHVKEAAKTAATEAWDGFKIMVKNKATEVKETVSDRVTGGKPAPKTAAVPVPVKPTAEEEQQQEARRRIIQMVVNGRISAEDAGRLIEQLDALKQYEKTQTAAPAKSG